MVLVLSDLQESFLSPVQSVLLFQRCRLLLACLQYNTQLGQHLRSHFREEFRFVTLLFERASWTEDEVEVLMERVISSLQVFCEAVMCWGEAAASLPDQPADTPTGRADPDSAQMIARKHACTDTWEKDCDSVCLYWSLSDWTLLLPRTNDTNQPGRNKQPSSTVYICIVKKLYL